MAEQEKMIGAIKNVLKPGGLLIISTPNKKTYSDNTGNKNPHHVKELYEHEFLGLLNQYFRNIELLKQQTTLSSLITAPRQGNLTMYAGDYDAINPATDTEALYFVALASDSILPVINSSLFNGQYVYENVLRERERFVAGTVTYKVGHFILYPFKLIRKLFNGKK
ncbi:MAG: hypothetical protein AAB221_03680 [Bacteroidota bacterium]